MTVQEFAPAKVNLWLRVTGRRDDGYHLLDSLVVFAGVGDVLQAEAADALTLRIDGPFAPALADTEGNLVLRAARALAPGRGARLTLTKNLPVASGIGGGSADAAAALRALAKLWGLDPAMAARLAPALGADVPVCLASAPTIMRGIGDVLAPAPALPEFGLLLVNPGVAVATADVFRRRADVFMENFRPGPWPDAAALAADVAAVGNALTDAAVAVTPLITDVLVALRALPGVLAAQMSGSGATCFALFASAMEAQAAAPHLPATWWRWAG